jgi:hypothetical protein
MTSTAFLSNPAPGRGDVNSNSPFSFTSSVGIKRDYGSLPTVNALQNPSLHNRVPDTLTNGTARAPIFVRPFSREFEKRYKEGDLLFVQRDERVAHGNQNIILNLPVLNYMLRTQKDANGDLIYEDRDGNDGLASITSGQHAINFFGIYNNDMDTGSKWQRLLNVNVRGRSRVARLWSPDLSKGSLKRGDILYIGFFKTQSKVDTKRYEDPNGNGYAFDESKVVYQARAVLECCDEGEHKIANASYIIPIGVVSQVSLKKPSKTLLNRAHQVSEASNLLERIEVLMRI